MFFSEYFSQFLFLNNGKVYSFKKVFPPSFFKKCVDTIFFNIFLVNFIANFQSNITQMFNFILNCVCFVFKVLFFKQHNGKVYSLSKVFTLVLLTYFQSYFQSVLSLIYSNFLTLFLNFVSFVFKVLFFKQHDGRAYSFNKVFTLSFLNKVYTLIFLNMFFSECFGQFLFLNNGKVYSFNKVLTLVFLTYFQSIFSQILVNFQ